MSSSNDDLLERARLAVESGNATALEKCFQEGLPISAINNHANSQILLSALDAQSQAIYEVLLAHGWNIDHTVETIGSALNSACWRLNSSLIRFLLSKGASPDDGAGIYGHANLVVLIIAADDQNKALEVLKLFLSSSLTKVDTSANGAVLAAVEKSSLDALKLIVEYGADVNSTADWDTNPDKPDRTPLYAAVSMGDTAKAKYLLEHGADPLWEMSSGQTVSQMAKDKGLSEVVRAIESGEN